ncbi:putative membrane protein YhjE [Lentibacillus kapialis]|uniref:TVP38/TMEM64 family membrane protein n=1 Tax=Lentibacillus kapialis TaxID=340214 RepID=A0A917PUP5_9BACI|nr:TVP38/TMEM64 family protein [Lentibacillus kapialis]GGJ92055.1 putative membrane protein YhjE [Lentibacillus kapialis]
MYLLNVSIMDWKIWLEKDKLDELIIHLLNEYESLGPLPGILLPFVEAFLPFLPLVVFVLANSAAYGLWKGFIFSWIGASVGSVLVFVLIRKLGDKRLFIALRRNKQVIRVTTWVERHGFGPLFLLMCFPFSPSSVINVVAGLSKISIQQFVLAVFMGKSVMIFSIAFVGSSIFEFAKNPVRTIVVGICIVLFWLFGKYIERRLHRKTVITENSGREQVKK